MAKGIENRARSPPAVFDFATSQIQKHGGTKMYYDLVESGKRINDYCSKVGGISGTQKLPGDMLVSSSDNCFISGTGTKA